MYLVAHASYLVTVSLFVQCVEQTTTDQSKYRLWLSRAMFALCICLIQVVALNFRALRAQCVRGQVSVLGASVRQMRLTNVSAIDARDSCSMLC